MIDKTDDSIRGKKFKKPARGQTISKVAGGLGGGGGGGGSPAMMIKKVIIQIVAKHLKVAGGFGGRQPPHVIQKVMIKLGRGTIEKVMIQ